VLNVTPAVLHSAQSKVFQSFVLTAFAIIPPLPFKPAPTCL
jgi:hypothetical protein